LLVKGGFIGVDIFFVISGYLISTIIIESLEGNNFCFVEFYIRRINRIFPALLLVLITCFAFGWFALLAVEYMQLGKHIAGGAGFVSNFLFWNESGYFDNAAETKPLLHLWSLGVEEQFYIIWPLMLWFAWKLRLNLLIITIVVLLISFVINVDKVNSDAVAAFYLPQTRFWELLVGSVLAYVILNKKKCFQNNKSMLDTWLYRRLQPIVSRLDANSIIFCNLQSLLGAALISFGILFINKETAFPGWIAVIPVAGAFLIISAGKQAWLNRVILSNRVLVWLGLISYPLYLWHWPLLSFARIVEGETTTPSVRIITILISIVLAWITYKIIEKPVRFGIHSKAKAYSLFAFMVIVGFIGYYAYITEGFPLRNGANLQSKYNGEIGHQPFYNYLKSNFSPCTPEYILNESNVFFNTRQCFQKDRDALDVIAIVGDSHAEHLFPGLASEVTNHGVVYYNRAGLPFISNKKFSNVFDLIIKDNKIKIVILSALWGNRTAKMKLDDIEEELVATSNALVEAGKKVYLADDNPHFPFDTHKCMYERRFSISSKCIQTSPPYIQKYNRYYPVFKEVQDIVGELHILEYSKFFCTKGVCRMEINGDILYRDSNHFNIIGSRFVARKLIDEHPELLN
jgi:peptidoglycan/LPS O-acetylase OafA/YrhL